MWFGLSSHEILKGIFEPVRLERGCPLEYPLVCTTEDLSQTDRVGEQHDEVGLVQLPINGNQSQD